METLADKGAHGIARLHDAACGAFATLYFDGTRGVLDLRRPADK